VQYFPLRRTDAAVIEKSDADREMTRGQDHDEKLHAFGHHQEG
jgi:hypothetical protein